MLHRQEERGNGITGRVRKLGEYIRSAFPRGVREMIYGHMYACDEMHVTRGDKWPWLSERAIYFNCYSEKE